MSSKTMTEEQKAATEARRAKFKELCELVSDMTPEQKAEMVARIGAVVTVAGRALSMHNSCMLIMQRPGVSMVGGFNQWREAGRKVKKGSTGLMIWAPKMGKAEESGATEPTEADKKQKTGFIPVYMFDIADTESIE